MNNYTREDILRMVEEEDVGFIRLQFTDIFGTMKNIAITTSQLEKALDNEIMFDGSSIEGFARVEESDMYLYPNLNTFEIFPWRPQQGKVARLICDVYKPDGTPYESDPRYILKKVMEDAKEMGYEFNVGPELEFFLFHTDDDGQPTTISHEKAGYFVSSIEIEGYTMYLNRIQYNGTAYVEADQDMIMNREGDSLKVVDVHTSTSDVKQTQVQLTLANEVNKKQPRLLTPKETILEENRTITLNSDRQVALYYVYVKGKVITTTESVTEAIRSANENMGVVISDEQQYIWKRSRKAIQGTLTDIAVGVEDENADSIAQCINAMLEKEGINISVSALIAGGETPKNILKNTMKDARILDLTGCDMEEVLYYVSCGKPVFAMTGSNDAVLLVGYDSGNVIIFDPLIGNVYKRNNADAAQMFADAGNVFFAYLTK